MKGISLYQIKFYKILRQTSFCKVTDTKFQNQIKMENSNFAILRAF